MSEAQPKRRTSRRSRPALAPEFHSNHYVFARRLGSTFASRIKMPIAESKLSRILSTMADSDSAPLRAYLDNGGDPNARYRDRSLLHWATQESDGKCVQMLLAAGARTEDYDKEEHFPLYQAAAEGSLEIIQLLIAGGADVNQCTAAGTALAIACAYEHIDIVRYLVQAGANPALADKSGASAISISIGYDSSDLLSAIKANKSP